MSIAFPRRALNAVHGRLVLDRRVRVLARNAAELLPSGIANLLDCGSGDGALGALVAQHRPEVMVVGLEVHTRPSSAIPVGLFDGRTIPFADRSKDAVMLIDVLHHADDPRALLREAARVARRVVIVKDHLTDAWLADVRLRAMDWVGNVGHGVALRYEYWSRAQWREAFADAGLVVREQREHLGIYPAMLGWLFERDLHFMALADPAGR
jgi:SAM-dependent methyltransferase